MEMSRIVTIVLIAFLAYTTTSALIYYPELPVDKTTLIKAQIALNRWDRCLDNTYNTCYENPRKIKRKTDLVVGQLRKVRDQLSQYNNVVLGKGNGLLGTKNIILGNHNSVYGNNNYIFSHGFNYANTKGGSATTPINNHLVNDEWVAELDRRH